jgi:hypothetical protein
LLFEDCVNGGRTVDFGIVQRTHYISITGHLRSDEQPAGVLRFELSAAPFHVRMLHREQARAVNGDVQDDGPQRHDGLVYAYVRHRRVV